jgi:glycosyltransferase involved in cell wall biosynthesis
MRILWISDSPTTPSGFGYVTRAVCERLAKRGYHVEILGWQTHGKTIYWKGIPVHPVRRNQFGSDVLLGYMLRLRPDFVITLADVWWMSFLTEPDVQRYLDLSGTRWVHYYPVDGADPKGRLPSGWIKVLKTADIPVSMSNFGANVSIACGITSTYIPHGCDVDIFTPPLDKEKAKARFGYDGAFVVLVDARNQPRKLLPRVLDIFKMFVRNKPDVILHLHTDPYDHAANSDLYRYKLLNDIDILELRERVRFTENFRMLASGGITQEELAAIYAAADVHLLCSWGEGFGLPNLQAASAGVVPIAVSYSASQELVEGHGFAIQPESTIIDEFGLVRYLISRESTVQVLEKLYNDRLLLTERSRLCRAFAISYNWDDIVDKWERMLKNAPQKRRPVRSRTINWVCGETQPELKDLPPSISGVMSETFTSLPQGVKMNIQMAERFQGEVSSEICREAFIHGDEISIPVRLSAFFPGSPRATIGYIMASPQDLPLAVRLKHIFPGITVAIPRPDGNPESSEQLPLEQILPVLPHCSIVVDYSSACAPNIDVACAALGVPYIGPSQLWPAVTMASPLHQVRKLLTDQGFSEWRRWIASERALTAFGPELIETLRKIALAGQPSPSGRKMNAPVMEMYLVRAKEESSVDVNERIAEYVASQGGLVLMATAGGSLFVAFSKRGKETLEACPNVGFVGGVHFDGNGKAARAIKQRFALNAAKQLATGGAIKI